MSKKHLVDFFIIIFIFLIDRTSKLLIISSPETYEQYGISVTSFLNFNLIWNEGIAFGLLSFDQDNAYNIVSFIILIVIIILTIMLFKAERLSRIAIIFILGGALGNFFDRIFYSAVPDFIEFHLKNFHWFIFNVADIFITLGVFCLIYVELINKNRRNEKNF